MRTVFEARASTILFRLAAATPEDAGVYLLPANVCPVVPLALLAARRRFEFIDLDPSTLCMSGDLLRARLAAGRQPPVAGVVFVRTYGAELEARPLFHGLKLLAGEALIIDDRCACRPLPEVAELDRQGADVVLFSTGYAKQVDLGFGGFAHLDEGVPYARKARAYDPADLERVTAVYQASIRARAPIYDDGDARAERQLRRFRWLETNRPAGDWREYRDLVVARRKPAEKRKATINGIYRDLIDPAAMLATGYHPWRFQIEVADPRRLLSEILEAGFFASNHYFPAAVLFGGHTCPEATALHGRIVNLFNDFRVSEADAAAIGRIVSHYLETGQPTRERP